MGLTLMTNLPFVGDLSRADLSRADLKGADLKSATARLDAE
ncbi:pentapeptide repeat-containing protein [Pseudomonas sp. SJZ131]